MARKFKKGAFLNCKIREELNESLNAYAEKTMLSKTAIVEKALEWYLSEEAEKAKNAEKEKEQ